MPDACKLASGAGAAPCTAAARGVLAARKGWLKNSSKDIRCTGLRLSRL